jgi:hypothetical protein
MSLLANVQLASLDWENRLNHGGQGEAWEIVLEQRDPVTKTYTGFLTVQAFGYRDKDAAGDRLPAGVAFELNVAEALLSYEDAKRAGAILHGQQRYQIVRGDQGESGIFPPTGHRRFWRFWIVPMEELP